VEGVTQLIGVDNLSFAYTEYSGHAIDICRKSAPEYDLVVAVGGDGTVNECVTGIMQSQSRTALAVIPMGGGNDFVKTAGGYNRLEGLVQAIASAKVKSIDVGLLEYQKVSEYFINIADAGLGPYAVKILNAAPKWLPDGLKYSASIILALVGYKKGLLKVSSAEFDWQGVAYAIVVANGKYFGSGLGIAPDATLDSGKFQCAIIGDISTLDYLRQLPNLKKSIKMIHPEVTYFEASSLTITGSGSMEQDGELGQDLPVTISCLPKAIDLLIAE
jgi:YegS/Rv2252/BmrU family lipid kinase